MSGGSSGPPVKRRRSGSTGRRRKLRHSFVSLMSSSEVPVEEIARLAGHSSSTTNEVVYGRELRPVLTTGAGTSAGSRLAGLCGSGGRMCCPPASMTRRCRGCCRIWLQSICAATPQGSLLIWLRPSSPTSAAVRHLADVVRIDPEFSPAEQDRARTAAARDPRLRIALGAAGYGLTQTLAAAARRQPRHHLQIRSRDPRPDPVSRGATPRAAVVGRSWAKRTGQIGWPEDAI
jgi:hypothetical protein